MTAGSPPPGPVVASGPLNDERGQGAFPTSAPHPDRRDHRRNARCRRDHGQPHHAVAIGRRRVRCSGRRLGFRGPDPVAGPPAVIYHIRSALLSLGPRLRDAAGVVQSPVERVDVVVG